MTRSCADAGHCWHLADHSVYARNDRHATDATADVACCWCPATITAPLYGRNSAGTPLRVEHGPNVPKAA